MPRSLRGNRPAASGIRRMRLGGRARAYLARGGPVLWPAMRVGVVVLPDVPWAQGRQRWQRVEEYGFQHGWTYDHLGWRELVDGPWFDAVPTLTAAATATTTLRLGTFVASPNFRHPVSFARAVTALDDISGC